MSICTNCGNTLSPNDRFCNNCGTPVSAPMPEETEVLVAPVAEETAALTPAPELTPAPAYDPNHIYKAKSEPVREPIFEPAYTPPAYTPPTYTPPTYAPARPTYPSYTPVEPVITGKTKALGFVGMGLGIGGFALAILGILYVLIGLSEIGYGIAFVFAIAFGIFSLPLSIVGRILSGRSQDEGNPSKTCSVGSALALAGIIVSAVMLFLGFVDILSA